MSTATKVTKQTKKGGNLTKQLSDLAVPFGLILAKQSLENFLKKESVKKESKPEKKSVKKTTKKVSLSGGGEHGNENEQKLKQELHSHGGKQVKSKRGGGSCFAASTSEVESFQPLNVEKLAKFTKVGGSVKKSPRSKKN